MLSLGASYSEVVEVLTTKNVPNPAGVIAEAVTRWVGEDKEMNDSRRAVQRRRLMRQVRIAMDEAKVGDAVRAEAILARLDDQEAEAAKNKISDDFQMQMESKSVEEVEFFVNNGRWPTAGEVESEKGEGGSDADENDQVH